MLYNAAALFLTLYLKHSVLVLVSLKPGFWKASSALIGQQAQYFVM